MVKDGDVGQEITGNNNNQFNSGENTTAAIGQGSMAAKGNITINHGVDSAEHAKALVEINELKKEIEILKNLAPAEAGNTSSNEINFNDGEFQRILAIEANKHAERMIRSGNFEFSGWVFRELGEISLDVGELDIAKGHFSSAYKAFTSEGDYIGRARALNDLGNVERQNNNTKYAEEKYNQALLLGQKHNHNATIAASFGNLALISKGLKVTEYLDKAESYFKKEGDWFGYARQFLNRLILTENIDKEYFRDKVKSTLELFDTLGEIRAKGMILKVLGLLEKENNGDLAENYLWSSIKIFNQIVDINEESHSLQLLSKLLRERDKFIDAHDVDLRLLEIYKKTKHSINQAYTLYRLHHYPYIKGNLSDAENYLSKSLIKFREIGNKNGQVTVLKLLNYVMLDAEKYPSAERYAKECLEVIEQIDDKSELAMLMNNLGHSLNQQNKLENAEDILRKGIEYAKSTGDHMSMAWLFWTLGENLELRDCHDEAVEYFTKSANTYREIGAEVPQFLIENGY